MPGPELGRIHHTRQDAGQPFLVDDRHQSLSALVDLVDTGGQVGPLAQERLQPLAEGRQPAHDVLVEDRSGHQRHQPDERPGPDGHAVTLGGKQLVVVEAVLLVPQPVLSKASAISAKCSKGSSPVSIPVILKPQKHSSVNRNRLELERLKRRRLEREAEAERLKQENLDRDKVGKEWKEKERMSLLESIYHKAFRKVKEGRGSDFDHLLLNTFEEGLVVSTGTCLGGGANLLPSNFYG